MSTDRHGNRRVTRDEFLVQGLYVGDGWVTLFSTFDSEAADARLRVLKAKSPLVAYRIEQLRVSSRQLAARGLANGR
jgi:sulfur relay (sulfurtransferase) DsrF/TusC family protein